MNDSRRRRDTVCAAASLMLGPVALALLTSCGSNAAPSPGGSAKATAPMTRVARERTVSAVASPANPTANAAQDDESELPPRRPDPAPFLCAQGTIAFDLSRLFPHPGTPDEFVQGWKEVQARTEIPGLVVAYSHLFTGPSIMVQVGAVRLASAGMYGFQRLLHPSDPVSMGLYADDPFHFRSISAGRDIVLAMGRRHEREGFVISQVAIDARIDTTCTYLSNIRVDLTLPGKMNAEQWFGGRKIPDALGPMGVDTDGDGAPDAWGVTLVGPSLTAMDFKL